MIRFAFAPRAFGLPAPPPLLIRTADATQTASGRLLEKMARCVTCCVLWGTRCCCACCTALVYRTSEWLGVVCRLRVSASREAGAGTSQRLLGHSCSSSSTAPSPFSPAEAEVHTTSPIRPLRSCTPARVPAFRSGIARGLGPFVCPIRPGGGCAKALQECRACGVIDGCGRVCCCRSEGQRADCSSPAGDASGLRAGSPPLPTSPLFSNHAAAINRMVNFQNQATLGL